MPEPFYIDYRSGRAYETEYDYAIMLAKEVKRKHGDTMTNIDFIISALGHGKNLELARRKLKGRMLRSGTGITADIQVRKEGEG